MAESEEELKSPLMKVKVESEKVGLKLNIQKIKIMGNGWGNSGNSVRLYFNLFSLVALASLSLHQGQSSSRPEGC